MKQNVHKIELKSNQAFFGCLTCTMRIRAQINSLLLLTTASMWAWWKYMHIDISEGNTEREEQAPTLQIQVTTYLQEFKTIKCERISVGNDP